MLQARVDYDDPIVLPLRRGAEHRQARSDGEYVIRTDAGADLCRWDENWKMHAVIYVRDSERVDCARSTRSSATPTPSGWSCASSTARSRGHLLEVEALPPGYPVVHEFLPDLQGLLRGLAGEGDPPMSIETSSAIRSPAAGDTMCAVLAATAAEHAGEPALRSADGSVDWTWGEYLERAREAAAGLAGLGLRRGDTMVCWLSNRPEFNVADAGAMLVGAASFSVYGTFTVEQAEHVVGDAGSRIIVTEPAFVEGALALRESDRTAIEHVVLVEGEHAGARIWDELLACAPEGFDVDAAAAAVEPDDLATLIYTSGTTGPPKGVQLTHRNLLAQIEATGSRVGLTEGLRAVSYLPMAHIAERMCTHYLPMATAWQVTTCSDPHAIASVLPQVRPGFFFSPPRLWEKLRAGVLASLDDRSRQTLDAAIERVRAGEGPQDGPLQQAVRAKVGFDDIRVAIVGAAPTPVEVLEFFHAIGIPIGELWGMSETCGVAAPSTRPDSDPDRHGRPAASPASRCSSAEDGEVLVRGEVVMSGYRNQPEKTAETIDADGWLHTGDIGEIDEDGYLKIVDRKKELIINAAGKNMSPANIEAHAQGRAAR